MNEELHSDAEGRYFNKDAAPIRAQSAGRDIDSFLRSHLEYVSVRRGGTLITMRVSKLVIDGDAT